MNNKFLLLLIALLFLGCSSHIPKKIEKYVNKHRDWNVTNIYELNLCDVLKTDYDTMFVFNSMTPLTAIRNIVANHTYSGNKIGDTFLLGHDSEGCLIILKKNGTIVYEDFYNYNHYAFVLEYWQFETFIGKGTFDGSPIDVKAYITTDKKFIIRKIEKNKYLISRIQNLPIISKNG